MLDPYGMTWFQPASSRLEDVENRSVRLPVGWVALHTGKAWAEIEFL